MKLFIYFCLISVGMWGIISFHNITSFQEDKGINHITVTDAIGRNVTIPHPLTSVAVINPYNAEFIAAVGAENAIQGIDRDIYENRFAFQKNFSKDMMIGGHGEQQVDYEKVIKLHPQVLILDAGFYAKRAEMILGLFGIKVLVLRADSTDRFLTNCDFIGKIFGKEKEAERLKDTFLPWIDYVNRQLSDVPRKKVYYECRRFGRAVIPGEAFNEMLDAAHADNIFSDSHSIYVNNEMIILRNPEYIVRLSDIGERYSYYPPSKSFFERVHREIINRPCWNYIDAVKNDRIFIYSYYSHGGAGKLVGAFYLAKYLYPEYLPDLHPEDIFYTWLTKYERVPYIAGHTYPRFSLYEGGAD